MRSSRRFHERALLAESATEACAAPVGKPAGHDDAAAARRLYQHARALVSRGEFATARREFEQAVALGHRAAQVDLARIHTHPAAGMVNPQLALRTYEKAWFDGVSIAAFELGKLYEFGLAGAATDAEPLLSADSSRAFAWYAKGAAAGEPQALARLADARLNVAQPTNADLQRAFQLYAAAAERARIEDWPTDAWRAWRNHQASLARLLARAGMQREVVQIYADVLHANNRP